MCQILTPLEASSAAALCLYKCLRLCGMEPIIASDNAETAVIVHGEKPLNEEDRKSEEPSSESESEEEEDFPPGPVDPEKCTVGGPGTTGGSAQVLFSTLPAVKVFAYWRQYRGPYDARSERLQEL